MHTAPEGAIYINELKTEEHASHSPILFYTCTLFLCFIAKMLYPYSSLIFLYRDLLCFAFIVKSYNKLNKMNCLDKWIYCYL